MSENIVKLSNAEASIIGAMLIDDKCVGDVLTRIREDDFITPRHRALFSAIRDLYNARLPVDPVLACDRVGGENMLKVATDCMDLTPTAANVLHYCDVLREQSGLYKLRRAAEALQEAETLDDARAILAQAQGILVSGPEMEFTTLTEMMVDFFQRLAQPRPDYIQWGFGMLDSMLRTEAGSYVILAARPSTGKTAMALQMCLSIAQKKRVGFFSLETSRTIVQDRMGAANVDITLPEIKDRRVTQSDLQVVLHQLTTNPLLQGNFEFCRVTSATVADIRTASLAKRFDVIFIDYVQLIAPSFRGDRTEQMQRVSMDLRAMAQATGIVVVALAQLKRPDSKERAKAPTMADLKESGQFEQDADTVMLLYHEDPSSRISDRLLTIEKNKEGYAGFTSRFRFDGNHQKFIYVDKDGRPIKAKFEEQEADGQMELPFEP